MSIVLIIIGSIIVYLISGFLAGRRAASNSLAYQRHAHPNANEDRFDDVAIGSFIGWGLLNPLYWIAVGIEFAVHGSMAGARRCIPELHEKDQKKKLARLQEEAQKRNAEIEKLEKEIGIKDGGGLHWS